MFLATTESGEVDGETGSLEAVRTFAEDFTDRNSKLVFLAFAIGNNFFFSF